MTGYLTAWVQLVTKRPILVLLMIGVLTLMLSWVAITQFRLNSDLSQLIDQKSDWRVHFDEFEAEFPDLVRTAAIVLRSTSIKQLENATQTVTDALEQQPDHFRAIAAPGSEAFFRDHALLYLEPDELDDMADRLAEAQPWLTAVATEPSLPRVLSLVEDGLANEAPEGFSKVVDLLTRSANDLLADRDPRIWWTDEIFSNSEMRYQLIFVKPALLNGTPISDAATVEALRAVLVQLQNNTAVEVFLTGEIPLQHEEIEAAVTGVSLAGWLAMALLLVVLIVGVRSIKIIAATFSMLAIGVIWTSAYAMLAVGEYNTLSLVFIVMFFGLGVDFALHFSLRFQEAINRDKGDVADALVASTTSVGRAISLCTVTTAMGFLGFWPTEYQGLADLGVISAGGMVVAWILTFTYLPAFYVLVGRPRAHEMELPTSDKIVHILLRHRTVVIGMVVLGGIAAGLLAAQAKFDYSVLALKDATSESMRGLRVLQSEKLSTDYQLFVLADDAFDIAGLKQSPVVDGVRVPEDFVPQDQEDKFFVIEDLQLILWSAIEPDLSGSSRLEDGEAPSNVENIRRSIAGLKQQLTKQLSGTPISSNLSEQQVDDFSQALDGLQSADAKTLLVWQSAVLDNLIEELAWVRRSLNVSPVSFDDLPTTVKDRLVSANGKRLAVITPAEDIADVNALSEFITGVRDLQPTATGRPVIEWGVGGIVIGSFQVALLTAICAIALVLVIALRRALPVMMILLPLTLTAICTLAFGVLISQPINMASILVLPLIFGLGVDNGIHVVDRFLGEGDVEHLIHSSTPRAVLLSTMTTIGAFAALSFSPHAGTASIGLLLTISIGFLLFFTVFLLPVLLTRKTT